MPELFSEFDVLGAFWMTIKLTVLSALGAFVIGTVVAVMRVAPSAFVRSLGSLFVNTIRNTPLTLLAVFCTLGLKVNMDIRLADPNSPTSIADTNFRWALIALAVYHAAFVCEAIRSGINTIPVGQAEAARSVGLSFGQSLRHVLIPQALRGAIAPLGNTLIALTKNTTIVSAIGVAEVSLLMGEMIENRPDLLFAIFAIVALGFVALTLPMGLLATSLSQRLAVKR